VISTVIGIFYALKDKRKKNTNDFLLGGQDMPLFPVALSLLASFLSAVSILGIPAEIYYKKTMLQETGAYLVPQVKNHLYFVYVYPSKHKISQLR
jgi:sodium-coupled monocarboxylate transporter 8/12